MTKPKFYVIGVDTYDHTDWEDGDFPTMEAALTHIIGQTEGKQMLMMHIYERRIDGTSIWRDSRGSF